MRLGCKIAETIDIVRTLCLETVCLNKKERDLDRNQATNLPKVHFFGAPKLDSEGSPRPPGWRKKKFKSSFYI